MPDLKYRRILLKISGEALAGEQEYGISSEVVRFIAEPHEIVTVAVRR